MNINRIFNVQYGKSSTRQKKVYTDDGLIYITSASNKHVNVVLKDLSGKEICRKQMQDTGDFESGKEMVLGHTSVYIDSTKENSNDMKNTSISKTEQSPLLQPQPKRFKSFDNSLNNVKQSPLANSSNIKQSPLTNSSNVKLDSILGNQSKLLSSKKIYLQDLPVEVTSNSGIKIHSYHEKDLKPHQREAVDFILRIFSRKNGIPNIHDLIQQQQRQQQQQHNDDSNSDTGSDDNLDWLENTNNLDSIDKNEKPQDIQIKPMIAGAILADEMGLGKTFVALTVMWAIIKHCNCKGVIVCPSSLISNWVKEVSKWIGDFRVRPIVVRPGQENSDVIRSYRYGNVPILIISYEMFRKHAQDLNQVSKFDIVICDEGHRLKNASGSKTIDSLMNCRASLRLVLTGTPIQNDLDELYSVVSFVAPGYLGSLPDFKSLIANPIIKAKLSSASLFEKLEGEKALSTVRSMLSHILLRRTQADILRSSLPPRLDVMILCTLDNLQKLSYDDEATELLKSVGFSDSEIEKSKLSDSSNLLTADQLQNDFYSIDDEAEEDNGNINYSTVLPTLQKLRQICNICSEEDTNSWKLSSNDSSQSSESKVGGLKPKGFVSHSSQYILSTLKSKPRQPDLIQMLNRSSKLQILLEILTAVRASGNDEKVVIVSNFTTMLDMISHLAQYKSWPYLRLDGSTVANKRQDLVDRFNSPVDASFLFLLSSKAGGVGLNLIGASRLVMMDCDWNPATDKQAMGRIWRPGQTKPVVIYRLVADKSIEYAILQRQSEKSRLSTVMDNDGSASALSSGSNKSIKDNSENEEKLLVAEDLSSTFVPLQIMNKSVLMSLLYPKSTSCVLTNIKDPIISNIINNPTMKQIISGLVIE